MLTYEDTLSNIRAVIDRAPFDGVQARFAVFLGVTPQALSQFISRGYLPLEQARKVSARFPDVRVRDLCNPEWSNYLCK